MIISYNCTDFLRFGLGGINYFLFSVVHQRIHEIPLLNESLILTSIMVRKYINMWIFYPKSAHFIERVDP